MMQNINKYTILILSITLLFMGCEKKNERFYIYKMSCEDDSVFMASRIENFCGFKKNTIAYYKVNNDTLIFGGCYRFQINQDSLFYIFGKNNDNKKLIFSRTLTDTVSINESWHLNSLKTIYLGSYFDKNYDTELHKFHIWDNCIDGLDVYLYFNQSYILYRMEKHYPESDMCNFYLLDKNTEDSSIYKEIKPKIMQNFK